MSSKDFLLQAFVYKSPVLCFRIFRSIIQRPILSFGVATFLAVPCLALCYFIYLSRSLQKFPESLPWAGVQSNQLFPRVRACFRQFYLGFGDLKEASEKYGKLGVSFVLPQPRFRPVVILPREHLRWLVKQPDSVLFERAALSDATGLQEMIPNLVLGFEFKLGSFIINTLRFNSQRKIHQDAETLLEDIGEVVDEVLGHDENEWKEINVLDTMTRITSRPGIRLVIGRSLCYDEGFTKQSERFALLLGTFGVIVGNYSPPGFRQVIGYILSIPLNYHFNRIVKRITPIVEERFSRLQHTDEKGPLPAEVPDDFMTWSVRAAIAGKYNGMGTPGAIAGSLATIGLGATPTSNLIGAQLFLDLCSANPDYLEQIRIEALSAFQAYQNDPDVPLASLLPHADSALRESLRLHPLFVPNPCVKVMAEAGITLPTGEHLKRGSLIGTPTFAIHHDPITYPEPEEYRPFRFMRPQSIGENGDQGAGAGAETDLSATTVSDTFLAFGAGRHTCPGRWIATISLKFILAYIAVHYELKHLSQRPVSMRVGLAEAPPLGAKIQVRRRKGF